MCANYLPCMSQKSPKALPHSNKPYLSGKVTESQKRQRDLPKVTKLKVAGLGFKPRPLWFSKNASAKTVIFFLLTRRGDVQAKTHSLENRSCCPIRSDCARSPPSEASHPTSLCKTQRWMALWEKTARSPGGQYPDKNLNPDANLIGHKGMRPDFGSHLYFLAV